MSVRDKSFLRALLNYDYVAHKEDIALNLILSMQQNPAKLPYALFNYTHGSCQLTFGVHTELAADFGYVVARAMRSGGRLRLHLMELFDDSTGLKTQLRLLPLHSESAELIKGLRQIANTTPPVTTVEELAPYRATRRVRDLINVDVLETH